MKKYLWIVVLAAVGVWYWMRKPNQPDRSQGAVINTNTATRPDDIWSGWDRIAVAAISNTTANVANVRDSIDSLTGNVTSLFGGFSKSTGQASPSTSGSGAGVFS